MDVYCCVWLCVVCEARTLNETATGAWSWLGQALHLPAAMHWSTKHSPGTASHLCTAAWFLDWNRAMLAEASSDQQQICFWRSCCDSKQFLTSLKKWKRNIYPEESLKRRSYPFVVRVFGTSQQLYGSPNVSTCHLPTATQARLPSQLRLGVVTRSPTTLGFTYWTAF